MGGIRTKLFVAFLGSLVATVAASTVVFAQRPTTTSTADRIAADRPENEASPEIARIVSALGLKSGEVVVDVGAGAGIYSLPLARAVGPSGTVYAEEIDQTLVDHIQQKVADQRVVNVRPILGGFTDPKLPRRDIDLAFFHNVLHHVADRAALLRTLATYLKASGRIAIIDGGHLGDPSLYISKEQVDEMMKAAGFARGRTVEGIVSDPNYFVIYSRN